MDVIDPPDDPSPRTGRPPPPTSWPIPWRPVTRGGPISGPRRGPTGLCYFAIDDRTVALGREAALKTVIVGRGRRPAAHPRLVRRLEAREAGCRWRSPPSRPGSPTASARPRQGPALRPFAPLWDQADAYGDRHRHIQGPRDRRRRDLQLGRGREAGGRDRRGVPDPGEEHGAGPPPAGGRPSAEARRR